LNCTHRFTTFERIGEVPVAPWTIIHRLEAISKLANTLKNQVKESIA